MAFLRKQIIFIGIGFYDYEEIIKKYIEEQGAIVNYINSCFNNFYSRFFKRIHMDKVATLYLQRLRTKQLRALPDNNDTIFVIKGENLSKEDLFYLKQHNPNAQFILYLWDSLIRHANKELLLENFDHIWSFDRKDCKENPLLKFRPLFYRNFFQTTTKYYYLSFIGWMHSDRLTIVRSIRNQLKAQNKSYYIKLYMGKFSYFFARYIIHQLDSDDKELITLKPIPYEKYQHITAASNIVLDITHPLQSGLTMRTIETLVAGSYLMTTNADIANYPEISANNYTVFDRKYPILPTQIGNIDSINNYFSIETFIKTIFNEK